jgi:hypothetical protein
MTKSHHKRAVIRQNFVKTWGLPPSWHVCLISRFVAPAVEPSCKSRPGKKASSVVSYWAHSNS